MAKPPDPARLDRLVAEARRQRAEREASYRGRALKLFPPVCARCGREFAGSRMRELTVHHKDGDQENNPPDGGNWELLCLYCHENEHARMLDEAARAGGSGAPGAAATYHPFADLKQRLEKKK
jgi:hypothetical protein